MSELGRSKKLENDAIRIAVPIASDKGVDSRSSFHFGRCWGFLIADLADGEISSFYVRENPGRSLERRRGVTAVNLLLDNKVEAVYAVEMGPGPFDMLTRNLIDIHRIPKDQRKKPAHEIIGERNRYPKAEEPFEEEH